MKILALFLSVIFSFSHSSLENLPDGLVSYPGDERVIVLAQNSFYSDVENSFIERKDEHLQYAPISISYKRNNIPSFSKGIRENTKIFKKVLYQRSTFK